MQPDRNSVFYKEVYEPESGMISVTDKFSLISEDGTTMISENGIIITLENYHLSRSIKTNPKIKRRDLSKPWKKIIY